jgi:hypothetical protein
MTFGAPFRSPQQRAQQAHYSPAQFNFRRKFLSSTLRYQGENHDD